MQIRISTRTRADAEAVAKLLPVPSEIRITETTPSAFVVNCNNVSNPIVHTNFYVNANGEDKGTVTIWAGSGHGTVPASLVLGVWVNPWDS